MPGDHRYLFVSYARADLERVRPLVDAVRAELAARALPVHVWMDVEDLRPGEQWHAVIADALKSSIGFLFFLSPSSLRSDHVRQQHIYVAMDSSRLIIPLILQEPLEVPSFLARWQALKYVGQPTPQDTAHTAAKIAKAVERYLRSTPEPRSAVSSTAAPVIAADMAKDVRASAESASPAGPPASVFVVHGHDMPTLTLLEQFLDSVGVEAIVLSRLDESPQSLFQKFMTLGSRAQFAIVLLAADDYGASRLQYDAQGVGERALQFRARQNVILELGFFYGKLGWENVFVVHKSPDRVFPNFERPSDLDGVVFDSIEDAGWQKKLAQRLSAAGFALRRRA